MCPCILCCGSVISVSERKPGVPAENKSVAQSVTELETKPDLCLRRKIACPRNGIDIAQSKTVSNTESKTETKTVSEEKLKMESEVERNRKRKRNRNYVLPHEGMPGVPAEAGLKTVSKTEAETETES